MQEVADMKAVLQVTNLLKLIILGIKSHYLFLQQLTERLAEKSGVQA